MEKLGPGIEDKTKIFIFLIFMWLSFDLFWRLFGLGDTGFAQNMIAITAINVLFLELYHMEN